MTKEELKKLKETIAYFGHWYDVIGEERVTILEKSIEYIVELEKENAELDCQKNRNKFCYSCVNATERCFTNEIGCPCEKYKSYKDENAELKETLKTYNGCGDWDNDFHTCRVYLQHEELQELQKENAELKEEIETKDILIKELQEQKSYWKDSSFDWRHKFFKKGSTKRLVQKSKQLTKAKELLAKWVELYKPKLEGFPKPPIQVDTEQFLKEEEK